MWNVSTPSKKTRLIVWKDYATSIRTSPQLYKKTGYRSWQHKRIKEIFLTQDQNKMDQQILQLRGYEFDEILFIDCDETFLPQEVKPQMWKAKLTYAKL